jgi:GTP-binding protein
VTAGVKTGADRDQAAAAVAHGGGPAIKLPRSYQDAHLLQSAAVAAQFPADRGAEVAIAGRSNAGKSSAINAILGRRALARISKMPGRTRLVNFFELLPQQRLVDLPGYGYAEGAQPERGRWAAMIDALILRHSLAGLILVVDARRGIQQADEQLLSWAAAHARPVHVLLSKSDLLKRAAARSLIAHCTAELAERATVQLFSSRELTGVDQAHEILAGWLQAPHTPAESPSRLAARGQKRKSPGSP